MALITLAFLASSAIVIMTPGPDLAFITHKVVRHGRRPAFAAAAGMISAGALQAAAGLAGVTLLLRGAPGLLTVLRWTGAAALFVFGAFAVRASMRPAAAGAAAPARESSHRAYLQGMACTGLNPKVGMFLMAYLPQFVPAGAAVGTAMAGLVAVYLGMGLAWLVIWTSLVHRLSRVLLVPRVLRISDALVGVVLMTFGLRLAVLNA